MTSPSRKTCIVSWQAWLAGTVAKHVDQNSSEISCNEGTEKKRKSRERSHGTRNYRSIISIVSSLLPRDRLFPADLYAFLYLFTFFFSLPLPPRFHRFVIVSIPTFFFFFQSLRDRPIRNSRSTVTCRPSLTTSR